MSEQTHDLARFVQAQEGVYETALGELRDGGKRSHWMWFVFPQVAGLGSSPMAQRYAIRSRLEAVAYLQHPILGPRLAAAAQALVDLPGRPTARDIMGSPDDVKLRSSMTLFASVAPPDAPFPAVLDRYFDGERDSRTLTFLGLAAG